MSSKGALPQESTLSRLITASRLILRDIDLFDKGGAMKKLRSYCDLTDVLAEIGDDDGNYVPVSEYVERLPVMPHALSYNGTPTCWCGVNHDD